MIEEEFYKKLRSQLEEKKPFVAYKKPGETSVRGLLQKDTDSNKIQDFTESGFVFAPFNPKNSAFLIPSDNSEFIQFEFSPILETQEENLSTAEIDFELMEQDQKDHENLVQMGIDRIKKGEFEKVVLSRSEKVEVLDADPVRVFKSLLKKYERAMVYLWYHPGTGFWMGATPETLLKVERTKFKTMALAGTQLFQGNAEVKWEKKEIEEQLFVTDFILESLEKLPSVTNLNVSKPYTARAGNLLHICTDISGFLKQSDNLKELIEILHPTPAVCGLPKQKAFQFIQENEAHDREYYSGYLGELNMKKEQKRSSNKRNQENQQFSSISRQSELFVNLRCMKMKDGEARIFVGGGITKDSNAADEWMETVNKSQTMKAVLVK